MTVSRRRFLEASALSTALAALPIASANAATPVALEVATHSGPMHDNNLYARFSRQAMRVMQLARDEAAKMNHSRIGSEHLLVGLAAEAEESGANWLTSIGASADDFRDITLCLFGFGVGQRRATALNTSENADLCVEYSIDEADLMGYESVTPEHILVGMLAVDGSGASQVMEEMWLETSQIYQEAFASLSSWGECHGEYPA